MKSVFFYYFLDYFQFSIKDELVLVVCSTMDFMFFLKKNINNIDFLIYVIFVHCALVSPSLSSLIPTLSLYLFFSFLLLFLCLRLFFFFIYFINFFYFYVFLLFFNICLIFMFFLKIFYYFLLCNTYILCFVLKNFFFFF